MRSATGECRADLFLKRTKEVKNPRGLSLLEFGLGFLVGIPGLCWTGMLSTIGNARLNSNCSIIIIIARCNIFILTTSLSYGPVMHLRYFSSCP